MAKRLAKHRALQLSLCSCLLKGLSGEGEGLVVGASPIRSRLHVYQMLVRLIPNTCPVVVGVWGPCPRLEWARPQAVYIIPLRPRCGISGAHTKVMAKPVLLWVPGPAPQVCLKADAFSSFYTSRAGGLSAWGYVTMHLENLAMSCTPGSSKPCTKNYIEETASFAFKLYYCTCSYITYWGKLCAAGHCEEHGALESISV